MGTETTVSRKEEEEQGKLSPCLAGYYCTEGGGLFSCGNAMAVVSETMYRGGHRNCTLIRLKGLLVSFGFKAQENVIRMAQYTISTWFVNTFVTAVLRS